MNGFLDFSTRGTLCEQSTTSPSSTRATAETSAPSENRVCTCDICVTAKPMNCTAAFTCDRKDFTHLHHGPHPREAPPKAFRFSKTTEATMQKQVYVGRPKKQQTPLSAAILNTEKQVLMGATKKKKQASTSTITVISKTDPTNRSG